MEILKSKRFNKILLKIYDNPYITLSDLSNSLNSSTSSILNILKKYNTNENYINKVRDGKFVKYFLTDEGKTYCSNIISKEESYKDSLNIDDEIFKQKKYSLFSFLLENGISSNKYFIILKTFEVEILCKTFSLQDFTILCELLDVLPKQENDIKLEKEVLNKFKQLILSDINAKTMEKTSNNP